jgi:hypothetical protein
LTNDDFTGQRGDRYGLSGSKISLPNNVNLIAFYLYAYDSKYFVKSEAIPLQAWTGPEGSRRVRLPDFKTIGTGRW